MRLIFEKRRKVIALAKALRRQKPDGSQMSLSAIGRALAAQGHLTYAGNPFSSTSVASMLGEERVKKRLTREDEKQIYDAYSLGVPSKHLAQKYGVSRQAIGNAMRRYVARPKVRLSSERRRFCWSKLIARMACAEVISAIVFAPTASKSCPSSFLLPAKASTRRSI